jgi:hypothetical protein
MQFLSRFERFFFINTWDISSWAPNFTVEEACKIPFSSETSHNKEKKKRNCYWNNLTEPDSHESQFIAASTFETQTENLIEIVLLYQ